MDTDIQKIFQTLEKILIEIAEIKGEIKLIYRDLQNGDARFGVIEKHIEELQKHDSSCRMKDPMTLHSVNFLMRSESELIEIIGHWRDKKNLQTDIKKNIVSNVIDVAFKIAVAGGLIVWGAVKVFGN